MAPPRKAMAAAPAPTPSKIDDTLSHPKLMLRWACVSVKDGAALRYQSNESKFAPVRYPRHLVTNAGLMGIDFPWALMLPGGKFHMTARGDMAAYPDAVEAARAAEDMLLLEGRGASGKPAAPVIPQRRPLPQR